MSISRILALVVILGGTGAFWSNHGYLGGGAMVEAPAEAPAAAPAEAPAAAPAETTTDGS